MEWANFCPFFVCEIFVKNNVYKNFRLFSLSYIFAPTKND